MARPRRKTATSRKASTTTRRRRTTREAPMTGHLVREDAHRLLLERNLPVVARSMTFAKLVQPNLRFLNLKDLLWLFPPICHRKDQAALTDNEKSRFICAFNMVNADGTLGQFVDIHAEMHMQHTNDRLLPWHRVFLHLFEEALHNYHPDVCIPYWDWSRVEEQHFPDWLVPVLPTVHTPTRTVNVIRAPGSDGGLAAIASGYRRQCRRQAIRRSRPRSTASTVRSTSGWAGRCRMRPSRRRIRCFGCTTRTWIDFGGLGTTVRRGIIRIRRSRVPMPSWTRGRTRRRTSVISRRWGTTMSDR